MTRGIKSSFIASMLCSQTWFESSFKVRVEPRLNELLLNESLGIKKIYMLYSSGTFYMGRAFAV